MLEPSTGSCATTVPVLAYELRRIKAAVGAGILMLFLLASCER